MLEELGFAQRQRLQFIESVAFWEGTVDRPRVSHVFGVTENHITNDFKVYKKSFPDNLDYDLSERVYKPGKRFRPRLSSGSADEYLALLRASQEGNRAVVIPAIGDGINATCVPYPIGRVDVKVLREITRALRQGKGLRVKYQSLSTAIPKPRDIWPHALVFAGMRWHIRAYDRERDDFIDLVLQRILTIQLIVAEASQDATDDKGWHTRKRVSVVPKSTLSPEQQKVVAREFGMTAITGGWEWSTDLRECLIPYFLETMGLDQNHGNDHLYLELTDRDLAKAFSFPERAELASTSASE